jgi:DNA repair exonuclease SbcCD ATPase subunit
MKIQKIEIENFKAFFTDPEKPYVFDIEENNCLIYGENGSGKSSLFKAFQDFFKRALIGSTFKFDRNFWAISMANPTHKIRFQFEGNNAPLNEGFYGN